MSEPMPYARDSSALAFALTRTNLSLPYSVEVAYDLEQFSLAARREALIILLLMKHNFSGNCSNNIIVSFSFVLGKRYLRI